MVDAAIGTLSGSEPASPFAHACSAGVHLNVANYWARRGDLRGKAIIDLACGDGRTTHLLRGLGATVATFDLFPEICKLADRPQYADVQHALPIADASADIVIFQEVIEHLPDQLFALQEIARILKPGGELFLTTPSRSSLASRLSYLCFESETLKATPWGATDGVWLQDEAGTKKCYGHLWLMGIQQLRTLSRVAGFASIRIERTEKSRSSVALMFVLYPLILLVSSRALWRDLRSTRDADRRREKIEQYKLNISPANLTNKFLFAILHR